MASLSLIPVGAHVRLHRLVRRQDLNGQPGVVIRTAKPSDPSAKHTVYLSPSENIPSDILIVCVENLERTATSCPTKVLSRKHFLRPALRLNSCSFGTLQDSFQEPFYYPFGNTSPIYLFPGIDSDSPTANILLLGCGDLRAPLYSLHRDNKQRVGARRTHFFANDYCTSTVARNVLFLWLIHRKRISPKLLFQIWFSLRISRSAFLAFCEAVLALTGPDAKSEFRQLNIHFYTKRDHILVHNVLVKWLSWQDDLTDERVTRMRESYYSNQHSTNLGKSLPDYVNAIATFAEHYDKVADENAPIRSIEHELREYGQTGVICFEDTPEFTNPTLFLRSTSYNLHYGSNPFSAFPHHAATYDATTPLKTKCLKQLTEWVDSLIEYGTLVSWTFCLEDCMTLSLKLCGPYDVISTSNVTDVCGILPLLQALRGIAIPHGYLLTQTLLAYFSANTIEEFLKKQLGVRPEVHASILGWRCIGQEGNLRNEDGVEGNIFPCALQFMTAAQNRGRRSLRCEVNLRWVKAHVSNLPIDASQCSHTQKLLSAVRPKMMASRSEIEVDSCLPKSLWYQERPLTMLPIMLLAANQGSDIIPADDSNMFELYDIFNYIRGIKSSRLSFATVEVPKSRLVEAFNKNYMLLMMYGHAEITALVVQNSIVTPYHGLQTTFDETDDCVKICWLMNRDRICNKAFVRIQVGAVPAFDFLRKDVMLQDLKPDFLKNWNNRMKMKRCNGLINGLHDSGDGWKVSLKMKNKWRADIRRGHEIKAQASDLGVVIVGSGSDMKDASKLLFPGPCTANIKVTINADKQEVTCDVQKGQYGLMEMFPCELFPDDMDKDTYIRICLPQSAFVSALCRLQFTDREISEPSGGLAERPAKHFLRLITGGLLLQKHDNIFVRLKGRNSLFESIVGMFVRNGNCRDHIYGTVSADVSVCFFEEKGCYRVKKWFLENECRFGRNYGQMDCTREQFMLLKSYVKTLRNGLKMRIGRDTGSGGHRLPQSWMRTKFKRVLLTPFIKE